MALFSRLGSLFFFALAPALASSAFAQQPPAVPAPAAAAPALQLDYPDNAGGLEHLAKDILKALKEGDTTRATALTRSMVLPNPSEWYESVFGEYTAKKEGAAYERDKNNIPDELLAFFSRTQESHQTDVSAVRFDKTCDDNAGEDTFGLLQERLQPTPLYELRFINGNQLTRLWLVVYAEGAFRFVKEPHPYNYFPPARKLATPKPPDAAAPKAADDDAPQRIRQGGTVSAATLIHRVVPEYPDIARSERLGGTVRLHAVIGKDGSISQLKVVKGYCSLAQAALKAVQHWRYRPTLLMGQPVEVDTTIDVIYSLNR